MATHQCHLFYYILVYFALQIAAKICSIEIFFHKVLVKTDILDGSTCWVIILNSSDMGQMVHANYKMVVKGLGCVTLELGYRVRLGIRFRGLVKVLGLGFKVRLGLGFRVKLGQGISIDYTRSAPCAPSKYILPLQLAAQVCPIKIFFIIILAQVGIIYFIIF